MDCEEFLRELKDCYRINGVELPDDRSLLCFASRSQANKTPFQKTSLDKVAAMYGCEGGASFKGSNCYAPNTTAQNFANPMSKHKIRLFSDFRDMVYTLAWELSRKIGRLPDSMHARMVLSADGHPMVRRYIEERGV